MQSCCDCECKLGEIVGEDSLGLTCEKLQRMSASEQMVGRSVKRRRKKLREGDSYRDAGSLGGEARVNKLEGACRRG